MYYCIKQLVQQYKRGDLLGKEETGSVDLRRFIYMFNDCESDDCRWITEYVLLVLESIILIFGFIAFGK